MQILGIVGLENSGKMTLISRLLPVLREYGINVSTVQYADETPSELVALARRKTTADLVLVEGPNGLPIDKIEVHNVQGQGGELLQYHDDRVVAVVADMHVMAGVDVPFFLRDEINGIAKFVVRRVRSAESAAVTLPIDASVSVPSIHAMVAGV